MFYLKFIKVVGFRGQKSPINIALDRHANFLIGRNGTGKTTLVNLIAHVLKYDSFAIGRSSFDEVRLILAADGERRRPQIIVKRDQQIGRAFTYTLRMHSRDAGVTATFGETEARWSGAGDRPWDNLIYHQVDSSASHKIRQMLNEIIGISWLALNRGVERYDLDEEEYTDNIDAKIHEVNQKLSAYFSRLDQKVSHENSTFQKNWFLSFLSNEGPAWVSRLTEVQEKEEKAALETIFRHFDVPEAMFRRRLERHFSQLVKAKDAYNSNDKHQYITDYMTLSDSWRLHRLVQSWYGFQAKQKSIYSPKSSFTQITSDLFYRKRVVVNSSNRLDVFSDDDKPILLTELSSGEKQMIIFLGETLLQEGGTNIFLADEPELSLHVAWQEGLVDNVKSLNPSAQIFFATHSPDIVSHYSENVIDMETII